MRSTAMSCRNRDETGAWPLVATRDSVCLADDIDAPHLSLLDVPREADAKQVAEAIMGKRPQQAVRIFGSSTAAARRDCGLAIRRRCALA